METFNEDNVLDLFKAKPEDLIPDNHEKWENDVKNYSILKSNGNVLKFDPKPENSMENAYINGKIKEYGEHAD